MGDMKYMMSERAVGKAAVIQGAVEGHYTVKVAAAKLRISERQAQRLKKAFRERGVEVFVHGNSGRHPANYRKDELRARIIALKKSGDYADTNFTHFRELLLERENIEISYGALSTLLKNAGIESKRTHRGGKRFKRRERRSREGDLLQVDASRYDWFGTGTRSVLHGFIDDATGKITALYLCQNECLMGYLEVLRQTLTSYGVPAELYADRAGIFFVNTKKPENWTITEQLAGKPLDKTQFATIVEDRLGITLIPAYTPQAKGRIERLWGTLQDRLPVWLRLEGVCDMDTANAALPRFIEAYNAHFSVESSDAESAFVPLASGDNLDTLLSVRHERTTDNCGCFSFQNVLFQVDSDRPLAKKKIQFLFNERIGFRALYDKRYYQVSLLGWSGKRTTTHLPDVVKILLQKTYYADGRVNPVVA
jgi:transposase